MTFKISSNKEFRSICGLVESDLPDFVVITGPNGSGKSHLLEFIAQDSKGDISIVLDSGAKVVPKLIVNPVPLAKTGSVSLSSMEDLKRRCKQIFASDHWKQKREKHLESKKDDLKLIKLVADRLGKQNFWELTEEEFQAYDIEPFDLLDDQIFQLNFANVIGAYFFLLHLNSLKAFQKQEYGIDLPFLNKDEFDLQYKNPIEIINEHLELLELNYELPSATPADFANNGYKAIFCTKDTKTEVPIERFSSGEKTLLSLVCSILNCVYLPKKTTIPNLLLLDEIDAFLHPSMTKKLIKTIEDVFIGTLKMKVMLTTHSPTTVALAPKQSVYSVRRDDVPKSLASISRDQAISSLLEGVSTVSVLHENRRQIFVESENDVQYYESIVNTIRGKLNLEISLHFLPAGKQHESGCSRASAIVKSLREAGVHTAYALLDRDKAVNGQSCQAWEILFGGKSRYSIENFIFDPIFIAAILIREKIGVDHEFGGIVPDNDHRSLAKLSAGELQQIVDLVTKDLFAKYITHLSEFQINHSKSREQIEGEIQRDRIDFETLSGISLKVERFLCDMNGHTLEEVVLKTYPGLNAFKKGKEHLLKLHFLTHALADLPNLITKDVKDTFYKIQVETAAAES